MITYRRRLMCSASGYIMAWACLEAMVASGDPLAPDQLSGQAP